MIITPTEQRFKSFSDWIRRFFELAFALLPLPAIIYLANFAPPDALFEAHGFHEFAIGIATVIGGFVSYVSWQCYHRSGEIFVKWLTIGFLGFTLIYSLHGLLTPTAHHNIWLFILYGPVSRIFLSICLLTAILRFKEEADPPSERTVGTYWGAWLALILIINLLVAVVANRPYAGNAAIRWVLEGGSIAFNVIGFVVMFFRGYRSPLMSFYGQSLFWFSFSSFGFMLSTAWNHQWWLAHIIFAIGFGILGYGVMRAYLTTQSFDKVFSSQELFEDLSQKYQRLQTTINQAESQNEQLSSNLKLTQATLVQFEKLFEISPDGILIVGEEGEILKSNPRAEEMFGYPQGALVGLAVEALIPERLRHNHLRDRRLRQYSNVTRPMGSINRPLECLRKNGEIFNASISISGIHVEGQQCHVTFVRDISGLLSLQAQRDRADQEALKQQRILKQVMSQVHIVVFQLLRKADGKYCFPYLSGRFESIFGLSAEDLKEDAGAWLATIHPADFSAFITALEHSVATRTAFETQWRAVLADGDAVPFLIRASEPDVTSDGDMIWTGYMRSTRQRSGDAPRGDPSPP